MKRLELETMVYMAEVSKENGGVTKVLVGGGRYVVSIEEPLSEKYVPFTSKDNVTLGAWLDLIIEGEDFLHDYYNLEYMVNLYENLAIGTWLDTEENFIECTLNVLTDNRHHAMMLAIEFEQRYIFDLEADEAISVEDLKQGGRNGL